MDGSTDGPAVGSVEGLVVREDEGSALGEAVGVKVVGLAVGAALGTSLDITDGH